MAIRSMWERRIFASFVLVLTAATAAAQETPFREVLGHVHPSAPAPALTPPNANVTGVWTTLGYGSPINPVHVALTHNGKILVISGSGNYPENHVLSAGVWDPATQRMTTFVIATDMFCNGMVVLPDGRPFVIGGTLSYKFTGLKSTALFDQATATFSAGPNMSDGRWYPTGTVLPDGTVMAISGLGTTGIMNKTVEIYDPVKNVISPAGAAFPDVQFFPRQHVLPSGKVFESGWNPNTQMWDTSTHVWTPVAVTQYGKDRTYGTSVLLPLTPANGYKPTVIIMGGGPSSSNITATTETIDLSAPKPAWAWGPNMVAPRIELNATLLPNGKVIVSGGSSQDEDAAKAVLPAEMYDPATNAFSPAGTMAFPRLYHSNTILLPDATVLALGGNPIRGAYEGHMEIYSPPYLYTSTGALASRPVIASAPPNIAYGASFALSTTAAATIGSVVVMRAGAVTHSFNMDQRLVGLSFTAGSGTLTVTAPANANLAPPGWYLIFILDTNGVPSVGKFVKIG
jgi:hypothetical protein